MPDDLHFHHTEPELVYDRNDGENLTDFKLTQFFINNTNTDVVVILRNNLPLTIKKSSGGYNSSKYFVIRSNYYFNTNARIIETINAIQEYKRHFTNRQEELEVLLETLIKIYNGNKDTRIAVIGIDRKIDISAIKENGHVFVPDMDILLHHEVFDFQCPHPFSIEGQALSEYGDFIKSRKTSGIFVELVDNENNISNRYMYVAKELMELPAKKDKNRPSGVYFTTANYNRLDEVSIKPEFYSFEDAEVKLGLYKTKEEAVSGGDPEQLTRINYKQKELEATEAKQELEKLKTEMKIKELERNETTNKVKYDLETEQNELKMKILKLEADLEMKRKQNAELKEEIESKRSQRNDYYEERSMHRKDQSELAKAAPAILIAAIGAFAYWHKK